jgi:DNA-binding protein YbaB
MTSPYEEIANQALADYQRRLDELTDSQRRMAEVSATAKSARQVVTVTVGGQGEVTDIKFPSGAYKNLTPGELSSVILKTINEARSQALAKAAEVLAPMFPAGFSPEDVLTGKTELRSLLPAEPRGWDDDPNPVRSER